MRKRLINDMGRLKLDELMEVLQELLDQPKPESKNYDEEIKELKAEVKKLEKVLKYKADIPPKLEEIKGVTYGPVTGKEFEYDPADVNKDGVVDEKDLSVVHKGYSKAKKAKKVK